MDNLQSNSAQATERDIYVNSMERMAKTQFRAMGCFTVMFVLIGILVVVSITELGNKMSITPRDVLKRVEEVHEDVQALKEEGR